MEPDDDGLAVDGVELTVLLPDPDAELEPEPFLPLRLPKLTAVSVAASKIALVI